MFSLPELVGYFIGVLSVFEGFRMLRPWAKRGPEMMPNDVNTGDSAPAKPNVIQRAYKRFCELHQHYLDVSTPHYYARWISWVVLALVYSIRCYLLQIYQTKLDATVPFAVGRWIGWIVLMLLYFLRVFFIQGWYIVTYALGIYLLNLFIAFLTPKIDPALHEPEDDGPTLPRSSNEEFKPFMRRLPEFKFWYSATKAVVIAMICTFFDALNVPVFWPILVMYFVILFTITMKRQIKHMVKYRYLPFSHGKTTYKGKDDSGQVVS